VHARCATQVEVSMGYPYMYSLASHGFFCQSTD
jgi:hypothetical protein